MEFFIHPDRLWHLLWIIPALTIAAIWAGARRKRALNQLLGKAHFSEKGKLPVGINTSPNKRLLRFFLLIATAILLTAAWARPSWGEKIVPFTGAGRDVVVALDLSKSMLCEDVKPNRLEHAKRFADELSARLPGDRFGLVSFAGKALDVCPLTFDRVSFRYILNDQQIGTVPVGGTNLEDALKTAASAFDADENPGHCAIVLISDGGELTGSLAREAEKLRAAKLPVIVIGVGDPAIAAPIPVPQENGRVTYLKDRDGNTVNTRLEERPLAELATKTGGVYIRSTTTEMGDTLAAAWIKKLTPGAQKDNVHAVPIERREWVLIPAFLFFSLYLLLGESLSRTRDLRSSAFRLLLRTPKLLVGTLLLIGLAGNLPVQAETTEAVENTPEESAESLYNRALQAQEQGDIARSRELYQSALARPQVSPELRSSTTQNLGAGFHAEGRNGTRETNQAAQTNLDEALKNADGAEKKFEQARTFYRDFLRTNDTAETAGTTRNLQILLNEMKQLEALKKQIQELKKQQQEAAQKAQNAAQQQQRANDEKNAGQAQDQQQQNAANQAREQARQAAEQMQRSAEKLNNESLKNAAREAARELQKAQEAQADGNGDKAEEHLKKATEILQSEMQKNEQSDSGKQDAADPKQSGDPSSENKDSRDENEDGNSSDDQGQDDLSQEPEEQSAAAGEAAEEERELDQAATEAVLRDMAQEEAERRRAIQKIRSSRVREVEKDW